jgi:hypothetical protein
MRSAYFDTSVFLAILNGEDVGMCLECTSLYSLDEGMLSRREQFSISTMQFQRPVPSKMELFPETEKTSLIQ